MAKQIKKYSKIALIVGLMIALVAMYVAIPAAKAGTLTDREVKLSDSRLSQGGVDYDFQATDASTTDLYCVKVEFCQSATGACTAPTGMTWGDVDKGNASDWNQLSFNDWSIISSTTNSISATTTIANQRLGANGSFVFGNVTSSSATSTYFAKIYTYSDQSCSTEVDSGVTAFAILGGVTVTATVAETLNVTVNASSCDGFVTGGTDATSTTTTIPFGTVSTETFYNSCQRIDIGTNAANGYNATIHKTQPLTYGSETIADGSCDGACTTTTEAVWQTATFNGFGYCMKDRDLNGAQVADAGWGTNYCSQSAANQFFKIIANSSANAVNIMKSTVATSTNAAWIGYRLSVDSAQAAGTYTTTIIYVVTPNY
ncbi:MAG: hypothetical protein ACE5WD_12120 [Candidatus Aminicenantia bacterium]